MTFLLFFICTCLCGGQRTSFRGQFSASTVWVPGLEHRLARLATSAFTLLSHHASIFFCICSMLSLALKLQGTGDPCASIACTGYFWRVLLGVTNCLWGFWFA